MKGEYHKHSDTHQLIYSCIYLYMPIYACIYACFIYIYLYMYIKQEVTKAFHQHVILYSVIDSTDWAKLISAVLLLNSELVYLSG